MTNAHSPIAEILESAELAGVALWVEEGKLRYRTSKGPLPHALRESLTGNREALIEALSAGPGARSEEKDRDTDEFAAFPLTDVQSAYLVGRREGHILGGVACHAFLVIDAGVLDHAALERAWTRLVTETPALRTRLDTDGTQRVIPAEQVVVPPVHLVDSEADPVLHEALRARMETQVFDAARPPLMDIALVRTPAADHLYVSVDFLVADWSGIVRMIDDLLTLHAGKEPPQRGTYSFRRYVLDAAAQDARRAEADQRWWAERLEWLAHPPAVPASYESAENRFRRLSRHFDDATTQKVARLAQSMNVSVSALLLALYGEAIASWSDAGAGTVVVTLFDRQPLHPDVGDVIGDFTSTGLVRVRDERQPRELRALASQAMLGLAEMLEHRAWSGVKVLRDIARTHGQSTAVFPFVFTSAISADGSARHSNIVDGVTQTPQVGVDCQVTGLSGGLSVNWDVRCGIFDDTVVDAMFEAFVDLVDRVASGVLSATDEVLVPVPAARLEARRLAVLESDREAAQAPASPVVAGDVIHRGVWHASTRAPEAVAVLDGDREVTAGQLSATAAGLSARLRQLGVGVGHKVIVSLAPSAERVAAVVGVVGAGAAYVPLATEDPAARRARIVEVCQARVVVTDIPDDPAWAGLTVVDAATLFEQPGADPTEVWTASLPSPEDTAYVIFTSGTTGDPKGVVISHRAATTTLADVARRYRVGPGDKVAAVSAMSFDLSVFDVFGCLGAGGAMVVCQGGKFADPAVWAELVSRHGVTLWNTTPAQMTMLLDAADAGAPAPESLRLVMVSGDWVDPRLWDRVTGYAPTCRVESLGGATEAGIWSIHHPMDDQSSTRTWVPYGVALTDQRMVVADEALRPRPDGVVGQILIGGDALADGYLADEEKTAASFVTDAAGTRWYRTGDQGVYLEDGSIRFLGRADTQVKVNGNRIELTGIEHAAVGSGLASSAVAVVTGRDDRRRGGHLALFARPRERESGPSAHATDTPVRMADMVMDRATGKLDQEHARRFRTALTTAARASMARFLQESGYADEPPGEVLEAWVADLRGADMLGGAHPDVEQAWQQAREASDGLIAPEVIDYFQAHEKVFAQLVRGEVDPANLLFTDGDRELSTELYTRSASARAQNRAIAGAAHGLLRDLTKRIGRAPRVLEVGAGTGATTASVTETIDGFDYRYVATDQSRLLVESLAEQWREDTRVTARVLSVPDGVAALRAEEDDFDLIVAVGVLNNVADIPGALRELRTLLGPSGWMIISDPAAEHPEILMSQAFMMERPVDDRAAGHRYFLAPDEWERALETAGAVKTHVTGRDSVLCEIGQPVVLAEFDSGLEPLDTEAVRSALRETLPESHMPLEIRELVEVPLTANGKIDRDALARTCGVPTTTSAPAEAHPLVLAICAEELNYPDLAAGDDLVAVGADSISLSRIVTRLRAEIPAAAALGFDAILRQLLDDPRPAALRFEEPAGAQAEAGCLVSYSASWAPGQEEDRVAQVLFHAPMGTLDALLPLINQLVEADRGPVVGVRVPSTEEYLATDVEELIVRQSQLYADALGDSGLRRVQLIGYSMGGLFAAGVADVLAAHGIDVVSVVAIDSLPLTVASDDPFFIEAMFLPNIGLSPAVFGLDLDLDAAADALEPLIARAGEGFRRGGFESLSGSPELEAVAAAAKSFANHDRAERIRLYAERVAGSAGRVDAAVDMVHPMLTMYEHSFRATASGVPVLTSDTLFLRAESEVSFMPGITDRCVELWRDSTLGEFTVETTPGNHYSCIEEPAAKTLAARLTRAVDEASEART